MAMMNNMTAIKTSSDGAWQGQNPLNFALPLLIVQTTLVIVVSRFFAFLLKPLRQPKVIAEILGGVILGPSAFGRNQEYMQTIFPEWSAPILESVSSIGLLFYLFLVGLELDLSSLRRNGKSAFCIAAAGISLPFVFGIGITFLFRRVVQGADEVGFAPYSVFMGVALSITAFPVLARILAELKLLTTDIGQTAMAAAAFNDVAAWVMLALAVALAGNGGGAAAHKSPVIPVYVLLSGVAFVIFMMLVIRPAMKWVARRCSPEHEAVEEAYVCLTLAGVMVAGFITDLIGIHSIFGAFVFGLTIPKGSVFSERLILRIEDFVSGLLLPLYFASSGLKTDVAKICGAEAWGLLVLVITAACSGKIIGTFVVAMLCKAPARESLTLGLLMNTKGLVELIVLNIGKEKKVLNDEVFAILVLMALFTTFITTPTVMAIYQPARGVTDYSHRQLQSPPSSSKDDELRVVACLHGSGNVSSLINLVDLIRPTKSSRFKLYVMHLLELTDRSSSIVMLQRFQKNGFPLISRLLPGSRRRLHDLVAVAFRAGGVSVRPATAVSPLPTMHADICRMAEEKRAFMIILQFHKRWVGSHGGDGDGEVVENMGHGWRGVNQMVLKEAPCSVALLVDRGFGEAAFLKTPEKSDGVERDAAVAQRICVIFIGGADDREALVLGGRMAEHPAVRVKVIQFVEKQEVEKSDLNKCKTADPEKEKGVDERAMEGFLRRWEGVVEYQVKETSNIINAVLTMGRSGDYDLLVVGIGRCPSKMVAELAERPAEHPELGPMGDLLASSGEGVVSSVLVIQQQQHYMARAPEVHPV
ncbi:PREDICTED: cation/H(+) antiporter 20 [Ipomoea nil]|uniref:cation/H(+) antiporter 20 n=1 Tax=Ipomoea nil TaxID=35883 RepID=UPI000901C12C|nr:PREDICTED: cation/H(+) antiporter 20 [Ipomoea nil]XP_019161333.1 PREDICTED: cation/H(+) antiporter 20 [Ipomoea nil]XP_019161334.1 PREDICTED: cation/H(+) antiporter 20 [Ipomoea nil]